MLKRIFSSLDVVASEYQKAGVKVVNAGYNSMVQSFPKQNFYDALGYSQEVIDKLLDDLVRRKGLESKEWLVENAIPQDDEWEDNFDIVSVPMEKSTEIVKKKVLDYLPLGPYKDNTYFVKRSMLIL